MKTTITATGKLFKIGLRQVLRDGMLFAMLPAPFLTGVLFKFGIPLLDALLKRELSFSLEPWFGLIDGLLLYMTPLLLAMIPSFLLLEERDEGIADFYRITPAGGLAYYMARLGLPMLWAFACSIVVGALFTLTVVSPVVLVAACLICTAAGIIMALGISHFAKNRVEGLALSKLTGLSLLGLLAAWFVPAPYAWLFGVMPSYWLGVLLK